MLLQSKTNVSLSAGSGCTPCSMQKLRKCFTPLLYVACVEDASARDMRSCSRAFKALLESQGLVLAVAAPVVRDERNE